MKLGRQGHSVIYDGENFLVVGGVNSITEVCTLDELEMTCKERGSALREYIDYPALFLTADDYGNDC